MTQDLWLWSQDIVKKVSWGGRRGVFCGPIFACEGFLLCYLILLERGEGIEGVVLSLGFVALLLLCCYSRGERGLRG